MKQSVTLSLGEFVALAALLTSLVALSIDAMLPALPSIGRDLGVREPNDSQLVVSALFLGLAVGQIIYGPLSDSIGRKPAIYMGLFLFVVGCLLSMLATNFELMLLGRVIQGFGAASARIVTLAMVRDLYSGREMARVMSLVMSVFILVPVIAPALGQAIESLAGWRAIFLFFLVLAVITGVWFAVRLTETLAESDRVDFSLSGFARSVWAVFTNRIVMGYSTVAGLIFGAFVGYLSSSQQILQEQYELGLKFPLYFAVLALAIGLASYVNARLVINFGMRKLSQTALLTLSGISLIFLPIAFHFNGHPVLWLLMAIFIVCIFLLRNFVWEYQCAGDGATGSCHRSGFRRGRFPFNNYLRPPRGFYWCLLRSIRYPTGIRVCNPGGIGIAGVAVDRKSIVSPVAMT